MAPRPEVLDAHEAATFLGAHVETVRRLARRGDIPSFKVGKDWRFHRESLLRWFEEQRPRSRLPHLLIVDGGAKMHRAIARVAERIGCVVHSATDGAEALAFVAHTAPALILLDLKMPKMNGPQFLAELRASHPYLPVIIVTGHPDSKLMAEAMRYGPLLLLSKPIEPAQLERALRLALGEEALKGRTRIAGTP